MRYLTTILVLVLSAASLLGANVQILVKPNDDANETAVQAAFSGQGATQVTNISQINVRVLSLPQAASTNAVNALSHNPLFQFAEFDQLIQGDFTPNDPSFSSQWHLPKIQAPQAWNTALGTNITIAICDTGVDATHPDLAANMIAGYNFYDNNASTVDVYGHGTAVAGVAAAVGNNAVGISGVVMNCRIMPLRISDTNGIASFSTMATAVTYAADHGARVANLSYKASDSLTVQNAAQYLSSKGGLLVVGAGNDGLVNTNADNPFILTISATDQNDALASFSGTGNNIDLAAPGVSILTTGNGGGYPSGSGTSYAAPCVAGVAALVMSANPNLTGLQVQAILKNNADDLGPAGWDTSFGFGRVNAFRAVQAAIGYTGTISVTATQGCNWTASPDVSWITIINGATGTGNGTVTYGVASNPTSSTRTGRITVASKVFFVTQTGIPCAFSISPTTDLLTDVGGTGIITLTANDMACAWTASSSASWLTVSPASGVGSANVSYIAAATSLGATRTATITIGGQTFTMTQTGDSTPPVVTLTVPANGSTISNIVTVTATATDSNMARVDFYVDSATAIGSDLSTPYSVPYNTTNLTNGAHGFYARAFDVAGNQTSSTTNSVTVNNSVIVTTNAWTLSFGSTGDDEGMAVASDGTNVIATGYFSTVSVDFGGGALTNAGSKDMYLIKYSAAGAHVWSKRFGSTGAENPKVITLDTSGNIYVGGYFTGTGNFGGSDLVGAGANDMFVAKYSSLGVHQWSKKFGSTSDDQVRGIAVDSSGNVTITGFFKGAVSFGGATFNTGDIALIDSFLAQYDTAGNHLWSKQFANPGVDTGDALAVDSGGNLYVGTTFNFSFNAGGGVVNTAGGTDIGLAKFNSAGTLQWQKTIGGVQGDRIYGIGVDSNGDVVATGLFQLQTVLGGATLTSIDSSIFLAKYTGAAGVHVWSMAYGNTTGTSLETPNSMTIDSNNNIIVAGLFQGNTSFGSISLGNAGAYDAFTFKCSPAAGAVVSVKSYGGLGLDSALGVASDLSGNIFLTGLFVGSGNFNGTTLTAHGASDPDIFLMKLTP